jgi:hypothetical protein
MFGKLRTKIGCFYFRKEQSKVERHVAMTNLTDAKKIGILYTLEDVPDYDRVSEFVAELQHDNKVVRALGFVRNKNLVSRFLPKLSFDFFSRRDLTWFYKPVHAKVKDFIEKEFDLLIDLSRNDNFPLKYIAGLSKAVCRVGHFSEDNGAFYDLMIDMKATKSTDEYLGQIRHYLTIINSHEKRA